MEIIRDLVNLRPGHRGSVATIGNFDGVHIGHQAILSALRREALARDLPPTVVTFEPTPREFFAPDDAPPRLTGFREKYDMLSNHGIARLLMLRFDQQLAGLSAEEFIRRVLVDGLGIEFLLVGDDFRFGKGREGDFAMLRAAGRKHGFEVESTPTQMLDNERVSSTRVRQALQAGELQQAARLLDRMYRISGRVIHGDKLGRTLGFPTANIKRRQDKLPLSGIFLVRVYGIESKPRYGVANVGTRPTVDGRKNLVEVYLFDFDDDLYGQQIEVEFLEKLREERRFDSLEALTAQIEKDVNDALLLRTEWQKREQAI